MLTYIHLVILGMKKNVNLLSHVRHIIVGVIYAPLTSYAVIRDKRIIRKYIKEKDKTYGLVHLWKINPIF